MSTAEAVKTRKQLASEAKALFDSAQAVVDLGDDATPEQMEAATKSFEDAKAIQDRLATSRAGLPGAEAIANRLAEFREERNPPALPAGPYVKTGDPVLDDAIKALGDDGAYAPPIWQIPRLGYAVTRHAGFRKWLDHVAPDGRVPSQFQGNSPAFAIDTTADGLKAFPALKTLVTSGTSSGGAFVWSDRRNELFANLKPFRKFSILDMLTRVRVSGKAVDFPRLTGWTNAAAIVAPATATAGASGAKPESEMTFEQVTVNIRVIAHIMAVINEVLADAPQLEDVITGFMRDGVQEELEDQVVSGDNTGTNFRGILADPDTLSQAFSTDLLVTIRKAITQVRVQSKRRPDGVAMSPATWETADLLKDNEARYYFGGPMQQGTPRIWGLPVLEAEAVPDANMIVAEWSQGILFDRQQTDIRVTESHSDWFGRNMVALRAEGRWGFLIRFPKAFCDCATS